MIMHRTTTKTGESQEFGRDFRRLCANEFPSLELARHLVTEKQQRLSEQEEASTQTTLGEQHTAARALTEEMRGLRALLTQHRSPWQPHSDPVSSLGDSALEKALDHFGLCSHAFGTPTILAALDVVVEVASCQAAHLDALQSSAQ